MQPIDRPIFIVGVPRSGTSLVYGILARHPDLAFLTKTTRKWPTSTSWMRLVQLLRRDARPTEAAAIWNRFQHGDDEALGRDDVTPEAVSHFERVIRAQTMLAGSPRFVSKHTRNGLRMPFFEAIFPGAVFLHVIRDGRATARSILRCRQRHGGEDGYWGVRPPGWREISEEDALLACARQWLLTLNTTRESAGTLTQSTYTEVRYEDLVRDPVATVTRMGEACGLAWSDADLARVTRNVEDRNRTWREGLTEERIAALNTMLGPTLAELGYEV